MKVMNLIKALMAFSVDVLAILVMVLFALGLILEFLYLDSKMTFKRWRCRLLQSSRK
ncbi:conserved hypothetical protein [Vibrio jasicida]|uniref:Uncharacterized protein n=1 Tax=Vibrio jasicida TaxID=766224 RepID=A0AAU9QJ02_9VIBR|nr:conserved hypothetical protein [Vibrio jasicida]CAH1581627.1 conserved hypothetical protein [Vibrio jasicida]